MIGGGDRDGVVFLPGVLLSTGVVGGVTLTLVRLDLLMEAYFSDRDGAWRGVAKVSSSESPFSSASPLSRTGDIFVVHPRFVFEKIY